VKIAALDLGSASFHLAVASVDGASGRLEIISTHKHMVRLGARTLVAGEIDADARDRALVAVADLAVRARQARPDLVAAVATSAIREAQNGKDVVEAIRQRTGISVEILEGREEARLVYVGARSSLPRELGTIAVVDLGGGAVHLAVGAGLECAGTYTLPLGVLRLRETHVPADGCVNERTAEAIAEHTRALASDATRAIRALAPQAVVFTAGTAKALVRLLHTLRDSEELSVTSLRRLTAILAKLKPAGLVEVGVDPARTDTIAAGAVVLRALLEELGAERAIVASRALREGLVLREYWRTMGSVSTGPNLPVRPPRRGDPVGAPHLRLFGR
jgi:exopolyphosphatase/guanosine-5'-triphosphate,3'-diphosphate pyrophosphatase